MSKQKVPDIDFKWFVLGEMTDLFERDKIFINPDYQRGDVWTHTQKVELIRSIDNRYSIGVLVVFINEEGQYEILDGQQRLLAINRYLKGELDLSATDLKPYEDLDKQGKCLMDAYCVYFLKLKSHDAATREEDIVQTFLRLQEGTPLNRAETISAHRGAFKDAFKRARATHPLFVILGAEKRFRWRLLAAEMLFFELESDFSNKVFPSLELRSLISATQKYEKRISQSKLRAYTGNLDILCRGLSYFLSALKPRDILLLYLLVSYLRCKRAGNQNIEKDIFGFAKEFHKNLVSFSVYDQKPPRGMDRLLFDRYKAYKLEAKVMTTPESIRKRFDMVLDEFSRMKPFKAKDPKRLHDEEQKRILYIRQEGKCEHCSKPMLLHESSADHMILHSKGGRTDDLKHSQLLHAGCHRKVEKARKHGGGQ